MKGKTDNSFNIKTKYIIKKKQFTIFKKLNMYIFIEHHKFVKMLSILIAILYHLKKLITK